MTEPGNEPRIYRGLKDVYFERSGTTFIDGKAGELRYRGYSIHDLAAHSCFEETAYLLIHGELPTGAELKAFDAELKAARTLTAGVLDVIKLVKHAHPMDVLRTAVSALAAFDPETADTSRAATIRKGVRLSSQVPMIVAAHERIRNGLAPLAPDPALGHAANFLWLLKGEKPSEDAAKLLQMSRAQQVVDVDESLLRQQPQGFPLDHQELASHRLFDPHPLVGQLAVFGRVLAGREQRRVAVGGEDIGRGVHRSLGWFQREGSRPLIGGLSQRREWRRQGRQCDSKAGRNGPRRGSPAGRIDKVGGRRTVLSCRPGRPGGR